VRGRPIPGTIQREEPAQPGRDVVLTIDAAIQHVAQSALLDAFEKHQAEAATAIVLDSKTFEILACANYPSYNVNRKGDYSLASRSNRAVATPFEPGSTLKPMTIAAALEEGEITPNSTFYCGGSRQIGRRTINCAHGAKHGTQNVTEVIRDSCNLASAEAALRLGRDKLWEYERRFGFGERTGAGFPGESRGSLPSRTVGAICSWPTSVSVRASR
jgi:cell division protein FtsI/penicillin-binding protein 2